MARVDSLTGLRWWAAFAVFLFHLRVFSPLPGPLTAVFDQGYLGVTFFFVLSGFVITWSLKPEISTSTFYWRRFARIWPATMAALLFAIPVFYYLGFGSQPDSFELKTFNVGVLLLSIVLLQGWWSNPVIFFSGNPAAWTLTFEAFFYAVHPLLFRVFHRLQVRGALVLVASMIICMFTYRAGAGLWPESWLLAIPLPVVRLPEFVIGIGLALALRGGWRPNLSPFLGVGSTVAVVLLIAVSVQQSQYWFIAYFGNELFTLAVGLAIVSLTSKSLKGKKSFFSSRAQVKLGEWSFAFYLVHATVIYLALRVFGYQEASWQNLGWMVGVFAIDLLLAWVLHTFVEKPAEKRIRGWKDRRNEIRDSLVSR